MIQARPMSKPKAKPRVARPRTRPSPATRRYAGRSADEWRFDRRERLLQAGLELFARQGFHATKIETLCQTAGVTARHFYEAFESRESLFAALYDRLISETRVKLIAAMQTPATSPRAQIERDVRTFVAAYTDDPRVARICCLEVLGVSEVMARRRAEVMHEFALIVEAAIQGFVERGLLPRMSFRLRAVGLVGAVNELISAWLLMPKLGSVESLMQELVGFYESNLVGTQVLWRNFATVASK